MYLIGTAAAGTKGKSTCVALWSFLYWILYLEPSFTKKGVREKLWQLILRAMSSWILLCVVKKPNDFVSHSRNISPVKHLTLTPNTMHYLPVWTMQTFVSEFYLKLSQYLWKVGGLCLEAAVGNISVLDTLLDFSASAPFCLSCEHIWIDE